MEDNLFAPVTRGSEGTTDAVPPSFVGNWKAGPDHVEIRSNGKLLMYGAVPYELRDFGRTLRFGSDYSRIYGDPSDIIGVWRLEPDGEDELTLRADGTATTHVSPDNDMPGEFKKDETAGILTYWETRVYLKVTGSSVDYSLLYGDTFRGKWSLNGRELKFVFPQTSFSLIKV